MAATRSGHCGGWCAVAHTTMATNLSTEEKAVIKAHATHGLIPGPILKLVRTTISRHLRAKRLKLTGQERPKYKKVTDTMVRQIVRWAVIRKQSTGQIQRSLKLDVAVRRVQQILDKNPYVKYQKL